MVKTVQTIVHRLKDEETSEDSLRDLKPHEDQQVTNKDLVVKVRKLSSEELTKSHFKVFEMFMTCDTVILVVY